MGTVVPTERVARESDRVKRIVEAIQEADHCPRFTSEDGEPCDGLQGCAECLRLAAEAVKAVDK